MKGVFAAITAQIVIGIALFTLPLLLGYGQSSISVLNMTLGSVVVLLGIGLFQYHYYAGCEQRPRCCTHFRRTLRPPASVSIDPPTLLCPLPSGMESERIR